MLSQANPFLMKIIRSSNFSSRSIFSHARTQRNQSRPLNITSGRQRAYRTCQKHQELAQTKRMIRMLPSRTCLQNHFKNPDCMGTPFQDDFAQARVTSHTYWYCDLQKRCLWEHKGCQSLPWVISRCYPVVDGAADRVTMGPNRSRPTGSVPTAL